MALVFFNIIKHSVENHKGAKLDMLSCNKMDPLHLQSHAGEIYFTHLECWRLYNLPVPKPLVIDGFMTFSVQSFVLSVVILTLMLPSYTSSPVIPTSV